MRVLITGSSGCIGAWVARALLQRGADVLGFDLNPTDRRLRMIAPPEILSKLRQQDGSIEDTGRMKSLVRDEGITHIVHLAAVLMPFCQANPGKGASVNVVGTQNIFEAARDAGRPVRIAYASSSAVWGPEDAYEARALNEADPLKPASFYGVYKQANEQCAQIFHASFGVSSIGLRPWCVYGPGRDGGLTGDPTFAMKAAVLGLPFRIRLSGVMDMQYVEDVAEDFVQSLLSPVEGAHVFNLAGTIVSMQEIIRLTAVAVPGADKLLTASGPQVPVAPHMDDTRLQAMIPGLKKTPLDEGIRRTVEVFRRLNAEGDLDPFLPA